MPPQRQDPAARFRHVVDIANFAGSAADEYIVRDINAGEPGSAWRWTLEHPQMSFMAEPRPGIRFFMDFAIAHATFRDTGPVTVTIDINGHRLGVVRCAHPGEYRFDEPVPPEWLNSEQLSIVTAEASPVWTSPLDGAHLGYLISQAGFR